MSGLFTEDTVYMNRVDLTALISKIESMDSTLKKFTTRRDLDLLCDGEIVGSKIVKKILGWSEKVFQNRLRTCEPHLPMRKNEGRWEITKEDFLNWFEKYKAIKY